MIPTRRLLYLELNMSCNVKINKHKIFVEIARQIASASTEIPKPTLQRSHHLTPNGTLFYPSEPF